MKRLALIALTATLAASCINRAPDYVIPEGRMERILYDYILAQQMAETGDGDHEALRYAYVEGVFSKYGITEADFDSSMVWYARDAARLHTMYDHIEQRFELEANKMGANVSDLPVYADMATEGDTANVWRAATLVALQADETTNVQTITLKADSSYHAGDYYKLVYDANFFSQAAQQEAFLLVKATYTNDSTFTATQRIYAGAGQELNIPQTSERKDWKTRAMKFTFYLPLSADRVPNLCLLTNIALVRYHIIEAPQDTTQTDSLRGDSLPLKW